jgi:hypothetical protein
LGVLKQQTEIHGDETKTALMIEKLGGGLWLKLLLVGGVPGDPLMVIFCPFIKEEGGLPACQYMNADEPLLNTR